MQAAGTVGNNAPNLRQPYHSSATIPLFSNAPTAVPSSAPTPQVPSLAPSASSPTVVLHDTPDPISSSNRVTNLVKPSFFAPPSSSALIIPPTSSIPTAAALQLPLNLQRPYGTPMLQPFPPPTPPPSLTPAGAPTSSDRHLITREKVHDALLMLVQVFHPSCFS